MKSRLFFREHGNVIPTCRRCGVAQAWLVPAVAIAAVLVLNAWGVEQDERAAQQDIALKEERASAFEAGRQTGRDEIIAALESGGVHMAALPREGCASIGLIGTPGTPGTPGAAAMKGQP